MLDSAWGKAMNLNLNGLPRWLPGDLLTRRGLFRRGRHRKAARRRGRSVRAWRRSLSRRRFDWPRFERMGQVVYQEAFDLHNRGSRSI